MWYKLNSLLQLLHLYPDPKGDGRKPAAIAKGG